MPRDKRPFERTQRSLNSLTSDTADVADDAPGGLLATEQPAPFATPSKLSERGQGSGSGRRMLNVELLYFTGCPHYQRALTVLQEAIKAAKVHASIDLVAVETQEEAERQRFYGSPTIRVNGMDIAPPDPLTQPTLACRVYRAAQGALSPIPPVEAIAAALHGAI